MVLDIGTLHAEDQFASYDHNYNAPRKHDNKLFSQRTVFFFWVEGERVESRIPVVDVIVGGGERAQAQIGTALMGEEKKSLDMNQQSDWHPLYKLYATCSFPRLLTFLLQLPLLTECESCGYRLIFINEKEKD